VILRFVHGWGFDRTLWEAVIALLAEHQCQVEDRGYFGAPESPPSTGEFLAVTHSLGTLHALAAPAPHCRGLIAINGFDRFSAAPGFPGIAERVLERMLHRHETDPAATLGEFRMRCGAPPPGAKLDRAALHRDLLMLRSMDCRAGPFPSPLVTLEAEDDPLLPLPLRDAVFASAPGRVRLRRPAGGHLLPLTAPAACAAAIRDVLDSL